MSPEERNDVLEFAARICEKMAEPPEGRDAWRTGSPEEWAAIKLEDAARAIRDRKTSIDPLRLYLVTWGGVCPMVRGTTADGIPKLEMCPTRPECYGKDYCQQTPLQRDGST